RLPEIGRCERERRCGPDRSDLRSRRLRRRISAEGFGVRRAGFDLRLCRRGAAAAGQYRQPAALADIAAAAARLSVPATLSAAKLSAALDVSAECGRPRKLWRVIQRADLVAGTRRCTG